METDVNVLSPSKESPRTSESAPRPLRRGVLGWVACIAGVLTLQAAFPGRTEAAGREASGSGTAADGPIDVGPFRRLEIDVPADIRYEVGGSGRVTIDAPAKVRDGIGVRVADGKLIIEAVGSWSSNRPVRIGIRGPADLAGATVAGASDIVFIGLKGGEFDLVAEGSSQAVIDAGTWQALKVRISDSARVTGRGRAERLAVQVSDSGDWEGAGFPGDTVDVRTDDSARARIQGRRTIEAHAAGASSVVTGGPAEVRRHVEDAATIDGHG